MMIHTTTAPMDCRSAVNMHGNTRPATCITSPHHPAPAPSRRALLSTMIAVASVSTMSPSAQAVGLESVDLPPIKLPEAAEKALAERAAAQQQRLKDAESRFQESELLSELKQRSDANRAKNKQDLQTKYCYRQAELGVGDCGGLRLVPEYRDQFVPKRPGWLDALVGGGKQE